MEKVLLIPIITLTTYLLYVYFRYGMTHSISATYQKLINKKEKLLLPIALWLTAFPIMTVGIYQSSTFLARILFFIAEAFILIISVAPMYWKNETLNNRQQAFMHYLGSYGGIGVGMIACLVYAFNPLSIILVSLYALFVITQMLIKKLQIPNHIYWMEVVAILIISIILYSNQQLVL